MVLPRRARVKWVALSYSIHCQTSSVLIVIVHKILMERVDGSSDVVVVRS
jgi:hypothetical protein